MGHRYHVYPVPTINIPTMHPGVRFVYYELYIGDGETVEVKTRRVDCCEPEIFEAQIFDLDGRVVRQLTPDEIVLCEHEAGE